MFEGEVCSIHPQGWVPIETHQLMEELVRQKMSSIHPQGWVPIETRPQNRLSGSWRGCSIHPQGWVPIETCLASQIEILDIHVAFTPKGGSDKGTTVWHGIAEAGAIFPAWA